MWSTICNHTICQFWLSDTDGVIFRRSETQCWNIVSGWTRNWYEYPVGISCSNFIRKALMKSGFFIVIVKFQCSRLIRLTVIVSFSISSVILFCRCKSSHIVENGDCVRSRTLNLMIWSILRQFERKYFTNGIKELH